VLDLHAPTRLQGVELRHTYNFAGKYVACFFRTIVAYIGTY